MLGVAGQSKVLLPSSIVVEELLVDNGKLRRVQIRHLPHVRMLIAGDGFKPTDGCGPAELQRHRGLGAVRVRLFVVLSLPWVTAKSRLKTERRVDEWDC